MQMFPPDADVYNDTSPKALCYSSQSSKPYITSYAYKLTPYLLYPPKYDETWGIMFDDLVKLTFTNHVVSSVQPCCFTLLYFTLL